jgi:hypothetical protein
MRKRRRSKLGMIEGNPFEEFAPSPLIFGGAA